MKTAIKPDAWYSIEATYSRSGAALGAVRRCQGKDIERKKRSLRALRPEGAADETAEGWYGRLRFHIEECAAPTEEASVDIDLDDTSSGYDDALDGSVVMGEAKRLGLRWSLKNKCGNQNLPVYTFTGARAALRELCRTIVPDGSFDPLGDDEGPPAPAPAPPAIRTIAEELATAKELAGAAAARADIFGDEASRLLRRVEEANALAQANRAEFEKESARAAALREVLSLLTTTTTKESI